MPKYFSVQALDDIDLNFKLVTSGLGDSSADEAALGVRRAQRSTAYSLLKQVKVIGSILCSYIPICDITLSCSSLRVYGPKSCPIFALGLLIGWLKWRLFYQSCH